MGSIYCFISENTIYRVVFFGDEWFLLKVSEKNSNINKDYSYIKCITNREQQRVFTIESLKQNPTYLC